MFTDQGLLSKGGCEGGTACLVCCYVCGFAPMQINALPLLLSFSKPKVEDCLSEYRGRNWDVLIKGARVRPCPGFSPLRTSVFLTMILPPTEVREALLCVLGFAVESHPNLFFLLHLGQREAIAAKAPKVSSWGQNEWYLLTI